MELLGRIRRFALIVSALLAIGFAGGCGGGGGGVSVSTQNLRSFDPNYIPDLKSLTHWDAFPVKVYFAPGPESTQHRQDLAVSGMSQWNGGTDGLVKFEVTKDPAAAQVTVEFVPSLDGTLIGWTTWNYDGSGNIRDADTKIGVKGLEDSDIEWVAAHEFGHALGLDGHSKLDTDVMFASHVLGSAWDLTTRDENTVKSDYASMLGGSKAPGRAVIWGPMFTSEAKCYRP
jgi:hypothetical protein